MDWLPLLLKLSHVVLAMALVAGLIGRWLMLEAAKRSDEIGRTKTFLQASAPFERMVILSSMAILPAGLLTAWAQGYPWLGLTTGWMLASVFLYVFISALIPTIFLPNGRRFADALDGAQRDGNVTPALRAAFAEPAVRAAHWAQAAAIAVIVALMVLKPF